eukprot:756589-Hanusia_phi.AAC.3
MAPQDRARKLQAANSSKFPAKEAIRSILRMEDGGRGEEGEGSGEAGGGMKGRRQPKLYSKLTGFINHRHSTTDPIHAEAAGENLKLLELVVGLDKLRDSTITPLHNHPSTAVPLSKKLFVHSRLAVSALEVISGMGEGRGGGGGGGLRPARREKTSRWAEQTPTNAEVLKWDSKEGNSRTIRQQGAVGAEKQKKSQAEEGGGQRGEGEERS